jgi:hypothetical protein
MRRAPRSRRDAPSVGSPSSTGEVNPSDAPAQPGNSTNADRSPGRSPGLLTARGVLLALVAQAAILLWVVRSEITARVFVSSWSLSMPGLLLLLALRLVRSRRRDRGSVPTFSQGELLTAYVVTSTTVFFVGYNFMQLLIPALGTPFAFASSTNRWARLFPYIPTWLAPRDPAVLRGLFQGQARVPWEAWLTPMAAWGSLILALALATLCLDLLLARSWIRQERLAFPLAALPLEISAPGGTLFRQPLLWVGFALPAVLESLLAINYYVPSVPAVVLKHGEVMEEIVNPPWSVLRPMLVGFTPFIIGLAFLAPTDVSFSIWFFQWLGKGQRLLALLYGWVDPTELGQRGEPHLDDQTVGAFMALGLLLAWRAVRTRRGDGLVPPAEARAEASREQGVRRGEEDGSRETRRLAGIGLGLCLAFVLLFFTSAGFPVGLAGAIVLLYLLTVMVIARVRAEAGFAWTYGPDRFTASLSHILVNTGGSAALAPRALTLLGFTHWLWWDLRFSPMPAQLEALKIGDATGMPRRRLAALIAAATLLALLVGFYACLTDSYRFGWATAHVYAGPAQGAKIGLTLASQWIDNPRLPDGTRAAWMGLGAGITLLLTAARQRLLWWPFHPLGYVMSATATSHAFWSHYFVAWLVKVVVLRYGGMRLYRRVLPFVFGLILGDVVTQSLWSLAGSLLDVPVYQFVS